jgi:ornithine--oxo-acid transaminase
MTEDIAALHDKREPERYGMHERHLNAQMVRVLRTIGYDVGFCRGKGAYLYDRDGERYLDLLSGFGVLRSVAIIRRCVRR